jgi:hypothetical protein
MFLKEKFNVGRRHDGMPMVGLDAAGSIRSPTADISTLKQLQ